MMIVRDVPHFKLNQNVFNIHLNILSVLLGARILNVLYNS